MSELKSEHEKEVRSLQRQLELAREMNQAYLKQIEEIHERGPTRCSSFLRAQAARRTTVGTERCAAIAAFTD